MKSRLTVLLFVSIFITNIFAQNDKISTDLNFKNTLDNAGILFEVAYTSEFFSNVSGGLEQRAFYIDNFDFLLNMDMYKSLGIKNAHAVFYVLGNNGDIPSDYVGAMQGITNIATTPTWKLYQAYFTQTLFNDQFSFVVGLYDLNSEYDVRETSSLFINPAHGIGTDYAQSGFNGPSIFPNAGLALSLSYNFTDNFLIRTGIFEGTPTNPNNPYGTQLQLDRNEGVLISSEINLEFGDFAELDNTFARYAIGGWYYTSEFEDIAGQNELGNPLKHKGTFGIYAYGEKYLLKTGSSGSLAGFLRVGMADSKVNQVDYYIGGGLIYYGLFNENDQLGLAVASAHNSDECRCATALDPYETNIELTYSTNIFEWLSIQPDIQYIINPSAEANIENSLVVGTRISVGF
ncbi:MAG: carbohydrate porin [Melioribacteraceae bacterium]|nr:carbohydrate porin [Melioribacteraceae bacterium]